MANPFPTRKLWQEAKKKNGIPDNLISKGSFGEHLEDLHKRYDKDHLDKLTSATANNAKLLSRDAKAVLADWEKGAAAKKTKFKNFAAAEKVLDEMRRAVAALDERIEVALNPLAGARDFFVKGAGKVKASIAAPTDARKLETAYREGLRNDIGQRMRAALKHAGEDKKAYPSSVVALLKQYDQLVQGWGSRIDDGDAGDILASDAERTKCFKDMREAVKIANKVLELTG